MKDDKDINAVREPQAYYNRSYTYADYIKFEFDHMVELIKGQIFKMTPAPSAFHQDISMKLSSDLYTFFSNRSCKVFHAPFDVVLPISNEQKDQSTTVVQPDICIICDLAKLDKAGCFGPPDLIVEILSPSTSKKDLNDKYEIYEQSGVKEYWIVMPREKLVEVFYLQQQRYQRVETYTEKETMYSVQFPELAVNLESVFEDIYKDQ